MKKAKIMLTAVTVLAIVGGALAFKANKTTDGFHQFTCVPGGAFGTCSLSSDVKYTGVDAGGLEPVIITGTYTNDDVTNQPCNNANDNCVTFNKDVFIE